jgi:endo-1,4-beta-xylanase
MWDPAFALRADVAPATLRHTFAQDFIIGVALNTAQVDGRQQRAGELAAEQFSAVTPENEMKWQSLHPEPDRYDFKAADRYGEFVGKYNMALIGHALVWHSQTPSWVFEETKCKLATRDVLITRMREHVYSATKAG